MPHDLAYRSPHLIKLRTLTLPSTELTRSLLIFVLQKAGVGRCCAEKDRSRGFGAVIVITDESEMGAFAGALPLAHRGGPVRLGSDTARDRNGRTCCGMRGPVLLRRKKGGHAFVTDEGTGFSTLHSAGSPIRNRLRSVSMPLQA